MYKNKKTSNLSKVLAKVFAKVFMLFLIFSLTACAVEVFPITSRERAERVNSDLQEIFSRQEPIMGPLTIYEAMARAIKYNLDHRVKLMEEVVAKGISDLSTYEMLPSVAASSGYTVRSNESGSNSKSLLSGLESLESSTSEEKSKVSTDLSIAWNVLDFGVSYVTAQQSADRVLIAKEARRKAVQNIIQDVRSAYWRAVGAQRLKKELDYLIEDVQQALDNSRQIEQERLEEPVKALEYQKTLLSTMRQLMALRREVSFAKLELAALMNLDPAQDFVLDGQDRPEHYGSEIDIPIRKLEQQALMNRPELRIEDYKARIGSNEVRKELLRLLPGIEITNSYNHSTNEYLYNKKWAEAGLRVTWNLLSFFTGPKNVEMAKTKKELGHVRRLALNVAVLTQVHVAYKRLKQSKEDFDVSVSLSEVNERLYHHAKRGEENFNANKLETIKRRADRLFSELRRDFAFAELRQAEGSLYLSLGVDPLPQVMTTSHVMAIADALKNKLSKWDSGQWQRELMSEYNSRMYGQMNNHLSYGRDDGYPNMRAQDFSGYDKRFYRQHSTYEQEHSPDFSGGQGVPEDIRKWAIGDWLDETVNTLAEEKAIAMAKRRARNSAPQPVYSEDEIRQKRRAERQREIFMRNREKYGYGNGGENYRRTYQYVRKNDPRFEEDLPRDDRFNQEYQDDGYGLDRKLGYGSYRPRKYGLRTNPYFKKQEEETYPHEVYQRPNYEQAPSRRYERPQPRRTYDKKPRDIRRYKPKPYSKEQSSSMPKSGYMQLGAYSNKNIAKHDWVKLVQNHASLRDYKPVIVPQDSKRGVLYKLIVKGNSQDLQGVCSNLKSKAQDCMVR